MDDDIDDPEISVILSTYNRLRSENDCPSLLQRAVASILNQTFTRFELILIDDASSDGSAEFCKQVAATDRRVRFYPFHQNSGIPAKRYNFGIGVSRGKYLSFMFDDDQWEQNALSDLHSAIKHLPESYGMVYGLTTLYAGSERKKFRTLGGKWGWNKIDSSNFIANNSVIVKRSVIDLVGGYDESPTFCRNCDWDLWWRIGRKFRIGRVKKRVAIVYSGLPDSIEKNKTLNWEACRKKQKSARQLPLQKTEGESLRSQAQTLLFDFYVTICQRYRVLKMARWAVRGFRKVAKDTLPDSVYQWLKKVI